MQPEPRTAKILNRDPRDRTRRPGKAPVGRWGWYWPLLAVSLLVLFGCFVKLAIYRPPGDLFAPKLSISISAALYGAA